MFYGEKYFFVYTIIVHATHSLAHLRVDFLARRGRKLWIFRVRDFQDRAARPLKQNLLPNPFLGTSLETPSP